MSHTLHFSILYVVEVSGSKTEISAFSVKEQKVNIWMLQFTYISPAGTAIYTFFVVVL